MAYSRSRLVARRGGPQHARLKADGAQGGLHPCSAAPGAHQGAAAPHNQSIFQGPKFTAAVADPGAGCLQLPWHKNAGHGRLPVHCHQQALTSGPWPKTSSQCGFLSQCPAGPRKPGRQLRRSCPSGACWKRACQRRPDANLALFCTGRWACTRRFASNGLTHQGNPLLRLERCRTGRLLGLATSHIVVGPCGAPCGCTAAACTEWPTPADDEPVHLCKASQQDTSASHCSWLHEAKAERISCVASQQQQLPQRRSRKSRRTHMPGIQCPSSPRS